MEILRVASWPALRSHTGPVFAPIFNVKTDQVLRPTMNIVCLSNITQEGVL